MEKVKVGVERLRLMVLAEGVYGCGRVLSGKETPDRVRAYFDGFKDALEELVKRGGQWEALLRECEELLQLAEGVARDAAGQSAMPAEVATH
jgi:hypothetical protein